MTAVLIGTASTAQAASVLAPPAPPIENITISDAHGKMTFIDDGDQFQVCDTKADSYGVTGQLIEMSTSTRVRLTVKDNGDAGCDTGGYDVGVWTSYKMGLVWDGGGDWTYSYHFKE